MRCAATGHINHGTVTGEYKIENMVMESDILERSVITTYESTANKPGNCVPDAPVLNVASQSGDVSGEITPDALARFEQIINMLSLELYASSHEQLGIKPSNRLVSGPQLKRESRSRLH